jgi:hypothetical protein
MKQNQAKDIISSIKMKLSNFEFPSLSRQKLIKTMAESFREIQHFEVVYSQKELEEVATYYSVIPLKSAVKGKRKSIDEKQKLIEALYKFFDQNQWFEEDPID